MAANTPQKFKRKRTDADKKIEMEETPHPILSTAKFFGWHDSSHLVGVNIDFCRDLFDFHNNCYEPAANEHDSHCKLCDVSEAHVDTCIRSYDDTIVADLGGSDNMAVFIRMISGYICRDYLVDMSRWEDWFPSPPPEPLTLSTKYRWANDFVDYEISNKTVYVVDISKSLYEMRDMMTESLSNGQSSRRIYAMFDLILDSLGELQNDWYPIMRMLEKWLLHPSVIDEGGFHPLVNMLQGTFDLVKMYLVDLNFVSSLEHNYDMYACEEASLRFTLPDFGFEDVNGKIETFEDLGRYLGAIMKAADTRMKT